MVLKTEQLVQHSFLDGSPELPLAIQPNNLQINTLAWAADRRQPLLDLLHRHGALLLRGFRIGGIETFETLIRTLFGPLLDYRERSSPRHVVEGRVYTSTDYPPEETIFLHNEQSYNLAWCGKICFYCTQPAETGGQTPIADTRSVLRGVDPEIRERFRRMGYIYRRNYGQGFGLHWREVFGTGDRNEVAAYCRKNGIHFEWGSGERLTTWQRRPAIRVHPITREEVWFNHCTFFHVTTLSPSMAQQLRSEFAEEDLPNQTFFGDGASIPDDVVGHLRQAYLANKRAFDWQADDVLILDNMLTSHGREPFRGPRRVLVAMAETATNSEEDAALGLEQNP